MNISLTTDIEKMFSVQYSGDNINLCFMGELIHNIHSETNTHIYARHPNLDYLITRINNGLYQVYEIGIDKYGIAKFNPVGQFKSVVIEHTGAIACYPANDEPPKTFGGETEYCPKLSDFSLKLTIAQKESNTFVHSA